MSRAKLRTSRVKIYLILEHYFGGCSKIFGFTILVFPISIICLEFQINQLKIDAFNEVCEYIE